GRYAAQTTPIMMLFGVVFICRWVAALARSVSSSRLLIFAIAIAGTILLAIVYSFPSPGHQAIEMGWNGTFLKQHELIYIVLFAVWGAAIAAIATGSMRGAISVAAVQGFVLLQLFGFTFVENLQTAD